MIKYIDKQAYKLKLFQKIKIYNIFHISLLELYDRVHKNTIPLSLPIDVKSKNKYKIKKVLNSKSYYRKLQYFVRLIYYLLLGFLLNIDLSAGKWLPI